MPKVIPIALYANIASETPTIAIGIKFTRTDGVIFGASNHDRNVIISGTTYESAAGFNPKDVVSADNLEVDTTEAEGILVTPSITAEDLRATRWDGAAYQMFQFDHTNPGSNEITLLRKGRLGEVRVNRNTFIAGMLGMMQYLQTSFGALTSPLCRHIFGDAGCTVVPASVSGTIDTAASDLLTMNDAARTEANGIFDFGVMTITNGLMTGMRREVKSYTVGQWLLHEQLPYDATGATYTMTEGCDNLYATCDTRFNNLLNRDAEDFLKGMDAFIQVGRKP